MYQDNIVLCGASSYEQKYYFNQDFASLPEAVKQELQIMCVLFTEDVGGILTLEFDEDGSLQFKTEALEADARFDEIGSALKIKELQRDKRELLESLEMYYKVFFLGDIPDEELKKKADAVEDESFCACTYGRSYGSCISKTLQGARSRTDLYGDGQRQGNFFS